MVWKGCRCDSLGVWRIHGAQKPTKINHELLHEIIKGLDGEQRELYFEKLYPVLGYDNRDSAYYIDLQEDVETAIHTATVDNIIDALYQLK